MGKREEGQCEQINGRAETFEDRGSRVVGVKYGFGVSVHTGSKMVPDEVCTFHHCIRPPYSGRQLGTPCRREEQRGPNFDMLQDERQFLHQTLR